MTQAAVDILAQAREQVLERGEGLSRDQVLAVLQLPDDQLEDLLGLAHATRRKMVQNLIWATAYNLIAIPLAAGVLYRWGILLPPAVGAIIMSVSTVVVAINARLLSLPERAA